MPRKLAPPKTVTAFATSSLRERLLSVQRRLRKAVQQNEDQHEPIHQLRVSTRRARTALEVFAPLLANKRKDWFEKKLRKLRHAAGDLRDLDICRLRFARHKTELPKGVESELDKQRGRAQKKIEQLAKKYDDKGWKKRLGQLISNPTPDGEDYLSAFANSVIEPFLGEFLKAVKSPDRSARQLHALRIAGKQLRYALELLAPVLRKRSCTNLLAQLEALQDILGEMNDYDTIAEVLDDLLKKVSGGKARKWLKAERQRVRESFSERRAKFLRGWTERERKRWEMLCEKCSAS
jgi:CHAD domain-containing protein